MMNSLFAQNNNRRKQKIDGLNDNEVLIFIHLMKTGGTTLFRLIEQRYPERKIFHYIPKKKGHTRQDLDAMPPVSQAQLKFIHGHAKFGFHHHLRQPARYMTMLREPVSRVISLYYFTHHNPNRNIPPHKRCPTLSSYLDTHLKAFNNAQTRAIAGSPAAKVPFGEETPEMLEMAKRNLDKFLMVGITERFDESVIVLKNTLKLNHILYSRINENSQRPKLNEIDSVDIERIRTYNILDQELYVYANDLLDQKINETGSSFQSEYDKFRQENSQFNALYIGSKKELEKCESSPENILNSSKFYWMKKVWQKLRQLWRKMS